MAFTTKKCCFNIPCFYFELLSFSCLVLMAFLFFFFFIFSKKKREKWQRAKREAEEKEYRERKEKARSQVLITIIVIGTRIHYQGPVVWSLVSVNRWLRGIKTYRFPWYLGLVSANHATSNPGQISIQIRYEYRCVKESILGYYCIPEVMYMKCFIYIYIVFLFWKMLLVLP